MSIRNRSVNWLIYFSMNNIELDILLNTVSVIYREGRVCDYNDLLSLSVFERLNPHLIEKLVSKGILKRFHKAGRTNYTLTTRGLKAFFSAISPVYRVLVEGNGVSREELPLLVSRHVVYGGIHRVMSVHRRIVDKITGILLEAGFAYERDGIVYPVDADERAEAIVRFINRVSHVVIIRRIDELVYSIVKALRVPVEKTDEIASAILYSGVAVASRDPRRALVELLDSVKSKITAATRAGKLLEAASYEALGILVIDALMGLGIRDRGLADLRNRYYFYFYHALGDYFYHNLAFDTARILYGKAISIAREYPELARDVQRVNAKKMLSSARGLAQRGRYEEAVARLNELIEYYRSVGMIQEAGIAEALKNEYLAEHEIRRGKPCLAAEYWEEAAAKYHELGGEYEGKARAYHVKAMISRSECLLVSEKKYDEAIRLLEEAAREAGNILSPHLRNVALSFLHESRAVKHVMDGRLLDAAREYMEASRYYMLRNFVPRAILSSARSHKFHAYHVIIEEEKPFDAEKSLGKAREEYMHLIKILYSRLTQHRPVDEYLLREAIKGYADTAAITSIIEALHIIEDSVIPAPHTLELVLEKLYNAAWLLVEGGRIEDYALAVEAIDIIRRVRNAAELRMLEKMIGEIAETVDKIYDEMRGPGTRPRYKAVATTIAMLLTKLKNGLETVTRYIEELR